MLRKNPNAAHVDYLQLFKKEQEHAAELKRLEEYKKQIAEERQKQELEDIAVNAGVKVYALMNESQPPRWISPLCYQFLVCLKPSAQGLPGLPSG